jgi:NitT/TauT family transport system substrate-binding protein
VSGCVGGDGGDGGDSSGGGNSIDELTVAYMPIYPDLQYFVMDEEGYLDEVDATIDGREFSDGPAIIRAFGSGDIDIAMFGIVPSMIVIDRGIPAKVTAANIKEPMAIMAHEDFQSMWDDNGADAFEMWEQQNGQKMRFGTFPQGSVPDVLLRYWLSEKVGVEPTDVADIIEINGANAVWQAIANGEIDGSSIMEPVPTIASAEGASVTTFKTAAEVMPGQPAAVTLMTDEVRETDLATQFLQQHVEATEFIQNNPDQTAGIVEDRLGMAQDRALSALQGPLSNFVTAPAEIENGTEIFSRFANQNDQIDEELSLDQIFDYSVYESL